MESITFNTWPSYSEEELNAVNKVLLSGKVNYWTGSEGREFEREFAQYVDCDYAVALANGTVALDLALKALDIGAGDEVIVTSRTFIASVSSIVNAGAIPVFADVDEDSQNITTDTIAAVLTDNTKAIICVHLAGWPCEMDQIMSLAERNRLYVIEDCAQAHGAVFKGRSVGSWGHVAAWSFCQDKIMSTGGEGGMVTTNSRQLWEKMWSYKDHGKSYDAVYHRDHPPGFRWLHESFGTNWRLTEMQAAIGRIQLRKLAEWTEQRQRNSLALDAVCQKYEAINVPIPPSHIEHARYKYYVFVRAEKLAAGWSRDRLVEEICSRGVPCYQGSCSEVYLEKAFDDTGWRPVRPLMAAQSLGEASLMFLVHPGLRMDKEIKKTCDVITQVMELASRAA